MKVKDLLKVCEASQQIRIVDSNTGVNLHIDNAYKYERDVINEHSKILNSVVICCKPRVFFNNETYMVHTFLDVFVEL